jgi:hypothetical protein
MTREGTCADVEIRFKLNRRKRKRKGLHTPLRLVLIARPACRKFFSAERP